MEFLEHVKKVFGSLYRPGLHELREAIASLSCTLNDIAPYVTEPECYPYGRNVIFHSDQVEVIVIYVPALKETYIHDHGESIGCGIVLEGELVNTMYALNEEKQPERLFGFKISSNHFFYAPMNQIHQMSNRSFDKLITLHAYSPPLCGAKVYEPAQYVLDFVI